MKELYLKHLRDVNELAFTEELLTCPKTMAFNNKWGGTVEFPCSQWQAFFDRYCTGNPNYEYFHIYYDNEPVGEISTRYDNRYDGFVLNIKVLDKFRGQGYGIRALRLFLDYLFREKGIDCLYDDVAKDNQGAIHLLEKVGFIEVEILPEAILYKLTQEDYLTL